MKSKLLLSEIRLENICYSVAHGEHRTTILKDITASWKVGTCVVLQGVSGSGKSTLLNIATGIVYPTSGAVWYGDMRLLKAHEDLWRSIRARDVGYVFQAPLLIPELSVLENVMTRFSVQGAFSKELQDEAYGLLSKLGIISVMGSVPTALSGGEQQRVSLARALMGNPSFVLMDEPTAHLDSAHRDQFIHVLGDFRAGNGPGMVIATHDNELARIADEVWTLEAGMLLQQK